MFEGVKAVLFDLDGTIYHGSKIIDGANEAIAHCRRLGKRVFFLTNNSARTRQQVLGRLQSMGIECVLEEVITSSYVSALSVLQQGFANLYVCGTDDLKAELRASGVEPVSADVAENLLVGYDPEFTYAKCAEAVRVAVHAKTIVACNKERVFRGEGAKLFPGCGAIVAAIEWSANREVDYLVGKPNTLLLETLCREFGYGVDDIVMVGDTYESDILMASRFGCASVLVGGEERDDTVVIDQIGDIVDIMK